MILIILLNQSYFIYQFILNFHYILSVYIHLSYSDLSGLYINTLQLYHTILYPFFNVFYFYFKVVITT